METAAPNRHHTLESVPMGEVDILAVCEARELDADEVKALRGSASISDKDRAALAKFALRKVFNYTLKMTPDWIEKYRGKERVYARLCQVYGLLHTQHASGAEGDANDLTLLPTADRDPMCMIVLHSPTPAVLNERQKDAYLGEACAFMLKTLGFDDGVLSVERVPCATIEAGREALALWLQEPMFSGSCEITRESFLAELYFEGHDCRHKHAWIFRTVLNFVNAILSHTYQVLVLSESRKGRHYQVMGISDVWATEALAADSLDSRPILQHHSVDYTLLELVACLPVSSSVRLRHGVKVQYGGVKGSRGAPSEPV
jgi:hypothetical protein